MNLNSFKCISIHLVLLFTAIIICGIIKRTWFSHKDKNVGDSRKYFSPTICEKKTKVKPGIQKVSSLSREKKNDTETSSWLGSLTKHLPSRKGQDVTQQKNPEQQKETNDGKMKSWFFSSKSTNTNISEKVDTTEKKSYKNNEAEVNIL